MIDVSLIKELCWCWYLWIYFGQLFKGLMYWVLVDIYEFICELWFYCCIVFVFQFGFFISEIVVVVVEFFDGVGVQEEIDLVEVFQSG